MELKTFYCTSIICMFRIDKERNLYLSQVKQKPKTKLVVTVQKECIYWTVFEVDALEVPHIEQSILYL